MYAFVPRNQEIAKQLQRAKTLTRNNVAANGIKHNTKILGWVPSPFRGQCWHLAVQVRDAPARTNPKPSRLQSPSHATTPVFKRYLPIQNSVFGSRCKKGDFTRLKNKPRQQPPQMRGPVAGYQLATQFYYGSLLRLGQGTLEIAGMAATKHGCRDFRRLMALKEVRMRPRLGPWEVSREVEKAMGGWSVSRKSAIQTRFYITYVLHQAETYRLIR